MENIWRQNKNIIVKNKQKKMTKTGKNKELHCNYRKSI